MPGELVATVVEPLGDALGLLRLWASRLHASKSACVGAVARATLHAATTDAAVTIAVAHFMLLMGSLLLIAADVASLRDGDRLLQARCQRCFCVRGTRRVLETVGPVA